MSITMERNKPGDSGVRDELKEEQCLKTTASPGPRRMGVHRGVGEKDSTALMLFPWKLAVPGPCPHPWNVGHRWGSPELGQLPVCKATEEGTQSPLSWKGFRGQGGGFGN